MYPAPPVTRTFWKKDLVGGLVPIAFATHSERLLFCQRWDWHHPGFLGWQWEGATKKRQRGCSGAACTVLVGDQINYFGSGYIVVTVTLDFYRFEDSVSLCIKFLAFTLDVHLPTYACASRRISYKIPSSKPLSACSPQFLPTVLRLIFFPSPGPFTTAADTHNHKPHPYERINGATPFYLPNASLHKHISHGNDSNKRLRRNRTY